jgi:hypothetical protein
MVFDLSKVGKVKITMDKYVEDVLAGCNELHQQMMIFSR